MIINYVKFKINRRQHEYYKYKLLTRAVVCGSQSPSGIRMEEIPRVESLVKTPDGGSSLNCSWMASLSRIYSKQHLSKVQN